MKLIELKIRNLGCIDENGVTVKIDDIVVLIGPNNAGKTTILKAYELFKNSGPMLTSDDFYQNNENNPVEIEGVFGEITDEDKVQIGEKWLYLNEDDEIVIKYKWHWRKSGVKGEKYSWNQSEKKWVAGGMGGWDSKIVKKRIEGGANEKAVWRLFINCPFVCINFDFFWLNKARQLYMDF